MKMVCADRKTGRHRHVSPWRLALSRLCHHRLAVFGLCLDAAVLLLVVFGGKLVDAGAEETRLWLGAQPPGYAHPHCPGEIVLEQGRPASLARRPGACRTLVYRMRGRVVRQVRIALRRGLIQAMTEGADPVSEIDLSAVGSPVHELGEDGAMGRKLPARERLVVGAAPPEGLFAPGQRVLFAAWEAFGETSEVTVILDKGVVEKLSMGAGDDMRQVGSVIIRGENVVAVTGDGKPLILKHPLGTDELGRDLLLRIVNGGRISLLVAAVATLVSLVVGVAYGAFAGYLGGRADAVMMRLVDILYGLPFIFLVLLLMVVFDRNVFLLFAALGLVQWLTMARIVRGQILSLKEQEFVEAARMGGASSLKIVVHHLLPHVLGPVVVYATLTVPVVILEESFLAFIGLPVQYQGTTLDSWGSLVHIGMSALGESGRNWWLLLFPSLAMVATLFGLNCLGDGLRDSLDPKGIRR